jgi:hypothetical protein
VPVIQVFAPLADDVEARLELLCRAVAEAMRLRPEDVVASWVPVAATVSPGTVGAVWPVVVMHGSRRADDVMERARAQAEACVAAWPGVDGPPWVTWQIRQ